MDGSINQSISKDNLEQGEGDPRRSFNLGLSTQQPKVKWDSIEITVVNVFERTCNTYTIQTLHKHPVL